MHPSFSASIFSHLQIVDPQVGSKADHTNTARYEGEADINHTNKCKHKARQCAGKAGIDTQKCKRK